MDKLSSFQIYKWMLSFVTPYRGLLILLVLSGVVIGSVELAFPKALQFLIDTSIPSGETDKFILILIGISVLIFLMVVTMAYRNRIERKLREYAARDIQWSMFQHLRTLGYPYFENKPTGDTLGLLQSSVKAVQEIYRIYLPSLLWRSIFALISLVFMVQISPLLTGLTLVSFMLYYFVGPILEKKSSQNKSQAYQYGKEYDKQIYDSVSAITEVKAYSAQPWIMDNFRKVHKQYSKQWLKALAIFHLSEVFRRFTYYVGAVAVLLYGPYCVHNGTMLVGELSAFILYYFTLMALLTAIMTDITEQKILLLQGERLYRFASEVPLLQEPDAPISLSNRSGTIRFEGVSFGYPNGPMLLDKLNLTIHQGERVAIVGESGNGKTTVMKLLSRFYDPTEGVISIDGIPLPLIPQSELSDLIGYVFQETYLFGTSIQENIRFGKPDASDTEVQEAALRAYAHEFILATKDGYETEVGERGIKLSGGQKQRISIARMMLKRPAIVLLDEATSALDRESEMRVQQSIRELQGATVIAVAHRLSTIQDFDRILVMDQGRVVEQGNWQDLITQRGALYALWTGREYMDAQ
ncbi:ABC transporter ATP-binding protein [Paenibacillus nasutitermitis]|uniref:ABC transporter ATP-binding protein YknV n=1 Tax=Paenibacillus nasutitermitis TaxID=1652958 RepID=A0A916ZL21_9BACL|nr:ABC transporter ATP-binding protein [Paenibacillus nasutitermitis]GGE02761.1 putative ABC transporter ATP-binding protein YknV [Paenibacillus nasutitermitis]